ncbi:unnamed protein product [Rhizophagus irregularis]|nr:unnamed protein product [Rhizophagus irregularis]
MHVSENEVVQKEFKLLKDDANIYKLIGPRLEYIKSEIQRVKKQLTDLNEKSEKKKLEVIELQKAYQDQIQKTSASS